MQNTLPKNMDNGSAQVIRDDLSALKDGTINLARDVKDNGAALARDGLDMAYNAGKHEVNKIEDYVKDKPGQSLLIAFAVGLLASRVLSARA